MDSGNIRALRKRCLRYPRKYEGSEPEMWAGIRAVISHQHNFDKLLNFFKAQFPHVEYRNNTNPIGMLWELSFIKYIGPKYIGLKKFFLMFYLFLKKRETEHERGKSRERARHKIQRRLQALSCQHRAQHGAWTHKLWDLSQSQTLNWLSHPSAPQTYRLLNY